jgi:hypothetical protein
MKHRFGVAPLLLLLLLGASATCRGSLTGPVSRGDWGGEHIGLVVTTNGGTIEYDCASGTIDEELIARDGLFSASGTHIRGHGGPIRQDENPDKHPARYDGQINGETMTLDVTLTDSGEKLGRYTLVRGKPAQVFKCL